LIKHTLLILDEQRNEALEHIQKRKNYIKKYFDKNEKSKTFEVGQQVLLWDSAHVEKGKHSKFQKLWIGPYKIVVVLGSNSYTLKDEYNRIFSYPMNDIHIKHFIDPFMGRI
jgi:hypothetical protein